MAREYHYTIASDVLFEVEGQEYWLASPISRNAFMDMWPAKLTIPVTRFRDTDQLCPQGKSGPSPVDSVTVISMATVSSPTPQTSSAAMGSKSNTVPSGSNYMFSTSESQTSRNACSDITNRDSKNVFTRSRHDSQVPQPMDLENRENVINISEELESINNFMNGVKLEGDSQNSEIYNAKTVSNHRIQGSTSRPTKSLNLSQPRNVRIKVSVEEELIVGFQGKLIIDIFDVQSGNDVSASTFCVQNKASTLLESRLLIRQHPTSTNRLVIGLVPNHCGETHLVLHDTSGNYQDELIPIDVEGNNPEVVFSEGEEWPIAITLDPSNENVYVAFLHHVTRYTRDGVYQYEVVRDEDVYFNHIVFNIDQIAASISGWMEELGCMIRFQEVRQYSLRGYLKWKIGLDPVIFNYPILHPDFDSKNNVVIVDATSISYCGKSGGLLKRAEVEGLSTVSDVRVNKANDHILILNGAQSIIQEYDEDGCLVKVFTIGDGQFQCTDVLDETESKRQQPPTSNPVTCDNNAVGRLHSMGATCFEFDTHGNLLVCNCLQNTLTVFNRDGEKAFSLQSSWDELKWPLSFCTSKDGHVYVADHGNKCIKRYRYLVPEESAK